MRLVTRWRVARRPGAHTPTSKIEKSVAEWVTSNLTLQPAPVGRTISILQAGTGQPATVLRAAAAGIPAGTGMLAVAADGGWTRLRTTARSRSGSSRVCCAA
jgi:hypothetical protein